MTEKALDTGTQRVATSRDLRARIASIVAEGGSGFVGRAESDRTRVLIVAGGLVRDISPAEARKMLGIPVKKRAS